MRIFATVLLLPALLIAGCASSGSTSPGECAGGSEFEEMIATAKADPAMSVTPPGTTASGAVETKCSKEPPISAEVSRVYTTNSAVAERTFLDELAQAGKWTRVGQPSTPKAVDYCYVKPIGGSISTLRFGDVNGREAKVWISLGEAAQFCWTGGTSDHP